MKDIHDSKNSVNSKYSQTRSILALELNGKLKNSNNQVKPSLLKDISAYDSIKSHFYINDKNFKNQGSNPSENKFEIK
jgi:hypothetical protein